MYELEKEKLSEPAMEVQANSYEQERPGGVTFLAVLNIIGAVIVGIIGLAALQYLQDASLAALYGTIGIGVMVFNITISVGLLRLKNWARIIAIVGYSLGAIGGLITLATGDPLGLFQLAVAITIIIYLNRHHVRQAFGAY